MALFYKEFPEISETVSNQLSWSNHISIIKSCKTEEERKFYRIFVVKENWSNRELKRQIDTQLCFRVI
jgi:predicted nuclease of restriction endonuclease-like (RecB) superfamily